MIQTTRYAAVLAKIGVERSTLLSDPKLRSLTECKSLGELASQLRETAYSQTMARINPPVNSRKLEYTLKETLVETYTKIIKYSPKSARSFLTLWLVAIEVENIKILVKAIAANLTNEEKLARIHLSAEEYLKRRTFFEDATRATDLRTFINALKRTGYATALTLGLRRYEETGSTQSFDILLDTEYYEQLWAAFQKLPNREKTHALFYASLENDSFTIVTLLRGKILGYNPNWLRLALPSHTFRISKETTETLVMAPDFDSSLAIAQKAYGGFFIKASAPEETVANIQKAFKKSLFMHACASVIREAFNIEAPLALMMQKDVEARNLEAIALGLEIGRKPQEIQSILVFQS